MQQVLDHYPIWLSLLSLVCLLLLLGWAGERRKHSQIRVLKRVIDPAHAVQVREMHLISNVAWFLTTIQRSDQ